MTVWWAAAAFVFAVLASLAARAAEELLAMYRVPRRWTWAASLLVCLAVPAVSLWTGWWPGGVLVGGISIAGPAVAETSARLPGLAWSVPDARPARGPGWPVLLAMAWGMVSAVLLLRLVLTWRRLARARSGWSPAELHGEQVLLTGDVGPAVAGLRKPAVLVPTWLLSEPASVQRLILLHEREHARAGDPWLLALAPLVPVLMPWNVALWWQLSRLRLAVELDCDGRVLRSGVSPASYGTLLLEVAERRGGRLAAAAALAEPRSFLERRIMAMSCRRPRRPVLRATSAGLTALVLLTAAFELAAPLVPDRVRPAVPATPARAVTHAMEAAVMPAAAVAEAEPRGTIEVEIPLHHAPPVSPDVSTAPAALPFVPGPQPAIVRPRPSSGPNQPVRRSARTVAAAPLIVVDGVIMGSQTASDVLDAVDVDEVEVVRAAAAERLYGSRAAGGLIRIRTRRGADGPASGAWESAGPRPAQERTHPGTAVEAGEYAGAPPTAPAPLILIDGVIVHPTAMQSLDPADISRIEVVKGAASAARWGAAGRNGVVLVTTVRGAAIR